jgi:formate hydrogenlyase subunit 3/multisubunit Na+/H+ antiporter MnhD subunit
MIAMTDLIELINVATAFSFVLLCLTPLLLALAMVIREWRDTLIQWAPWAALPALLVAIIWVENSGQNFYFTWGLLGAEFGLDASRRAFLGVTALLWLMTGLFARIFMAQDKRLHQFFIFFLLSMAGNLGVIIAEDIISFYTFFALMSFSAYGLVIYRRYEDETVLQAGRIYLSFVIIGEMLLFAALLLMAHAAIADNDQVFSLRKIAEIMATAEYQNIIIAFVLIGFGIKAGLFLLHVSLPITYQGLPVAAAIVMGGAMLHTGVLGWVRFLPLGQFDAPIWGSLLLLLGIIAVFYGVLVGLMQTQAQVVLAYSSISQIGLVVIMLGLGWHSAGSWGILQALLFTFLLHHTLTKGALFFGYGLLQIEMTKKQRLILLFSLAIPALMIVGAPLTSGIFIKTELKQIIVDYSVVGFNFLPLALSVSTVTSSLLLLHFLRLASRVEMKTAIDFSLKSALWIIWGIWLLGLLFAAIWLYSHHISLLSDAVLMESALMLIIAIFLFVLFLFLKQKYFVSLRFNIPAGDVFWFVRNAVIKLGLHLFAIGQVFYAKWQILWQGILLSLQKISILPTICLTYVEQRLLAWPVAGFLLLFLGLTFWMAQFLSYQ